MVYSLRAAEEVDEGVVVGQRHVSVKTRQVAEPKEMGAGENDDEAVACRPMDVEVGSLDVVCICRHAVRTCSKKFDCHHVTASHHMHVSERLLDASTVTVVYGKTLVQDDDARTA